MREVTKCERCGELWPDLAVGVFVSRITAARVFICLACLTTLTGMVNREVAEELQKELRQRNA